jgi:signal peptidase I
MNPTPPPPPLPQLQSSPLSRGNKLVIGLALITCFFVGAVIVLRLFGLIRPFAVPTGTMTPAISTGDHVFMEGMTFLARKPRHGDIVVFKTDGIGSLQTGSFFVKRIAGEPGDHSRIAEGKLFVNDQRVALSNAMGEIVYYIPPLTGTLTPKTDVTVPTGCYFVLGDNSRNSLDSRYFGAIPRDNIIGQVVLCYWPLQRVGGVK